VIFVVTVAKPMNPEAQPLFLAGHPALDFLNTSYAPQGGPLEVIPDGQAFLRWAVEAAWIDAATASKLKRRFGASALDELAAEARKFRDWAAAWIARWSADPSADYAGELRRLNALLARQHGYSELVREPEGLRLLSRERLGSPEELLARIAHSFALLLASEAPELVKRCAGADCTLWFLDQTKSHRRLFCSASACGNRAKVAAFRERQRG
jgi:predicted RNA-binding Zn ribbon-like protein